MENIPYYGDNLEILRRFIKDESVDLIYLNPSFHYAHGPRCTIINLTGRVAQERRILPCMILTDPKG